MTELKFFVGEICPHCGGTHFTTETQNVEIQQVAQFVANPIEIVEYHRHYHQCTLCQTVSAAVKYWLERNSSHALLKRYNYLTFVK